MPCASEERPRERAVAEVFGHAPEIIRGTNAKDCKEGVCGHLYIGVKSGDEEYDDIEHESDAQEARCVLCPFLVAFPPSFPFFCFPYHILVCYFSQR